MRLSAVRYLPLIFVLIGVSGPAHADAIDGNWCHPAGGNLEIHGSDIITPGGAQISGDYTRHTFRYVAPTGERAEGHTINMASIDDETMHLIVEEPGATIEVWRRCAVNVS
jgi:hypothetical protein